MYPVKKNSWAGIEKEQLKGHATLTILHSLYMNEAGDIIVVWMFWFVWRSLRVFNVMTKLHGLLSACALRVTARSFSGGTFLLIQIITLIGSSSEDAFLPRLPSAGFSKPSSFIILDVNED